MAGTALCAVTLLLCFVALEVGFRVTEAVSVPEGELWATYDPDLGYRLNPAYPGTNAHGMRDRPVPPPDGRTRVLILGDSVAYYGDDVDDTFVGHLRANLERDPALAPTVVMNAGTKGYTNYQELLWLKKFGVALEPDVVGVAFVLNDLHRVLHAFRVEDGKIVGQNYDFTAEAVGTVDNPLYQLARKSRFLVWLRRRFADALATVESSALDSQSRFTFDLRPDFNTAWRDAPWADIEAQLREMRDLGRARGFAVFVVAFPFGQQYRDDYLARDRDYVLKPQRVLARIVESLGIPYLDLYPLLDPAHDLDRDEIHLTTDGRRKVGSLVGEFMSRAGLVPPASR